VVDLVYYVSSVDMSVIDLGAKGGGNFLSRRLNKILETKLENDTLEALKELSTFFTENTLQARRNLRSKIEKRSLAINEVICMYSHH
jgi:Conserved oligomeric complex COG6.